MDWCTCTHLYTKQEVVYADIGPNSELAGQESLYVLTEDKVEYVELKFQTKPWKGTHESGEALALENCDRIGKRGHCDIT